MLNMDSAPLRLRRTAQQGMVLLVALIVLVAITVAGMAMMRSVDTATLVAGNLAFQQAATQASDKGVESAIAMLRQKLVDDSLSDNDTSNGYIATLQATDSPAAGESWQAYWDANLKGIAYDTGEDLYKNHVYFVVHRMCQNALPPGSGGQCVASPAVTTTKGNSEEAGEIQLNSASQIYYRITVRVAGPRRTESYVQTTVAM
jgi:Tfp pilus assembly protein PilX